MFYITDQDNKIYSLQYDIIYYIKSKKVSTKEYYLKQCCFEIICNKKVDNYSSTRTSVLNIWNKLKT